MSSKRIKKPIRRKKKSDYPGEMSFRKVLGMNPTYYQEGGKLYYQEKLGKLPVKYVENRDDPAFIAYKDSFDLAKLTDIQREREGAAKFISLSSMPQSGRDFRNAEKNNLGKNPNAPKGYYNDKDADYVTYNTARQSLNNPRIFISPRGSADIFHPSIDPTSVYFSSKGAANAYYPYPKQQVAIKPSGGTEGYTHQYTHTNPFTGKKEQRVVVKEKVGDQVISKYLNWDQYQKQKESKEYSNFLYQDKEPAIIPKQQGGKLYYQEDEGNLPTVKYGTPEYEQAYNQGTLTTRLSGDPEDFVRAKTIPAYTFEYKDGFSDLPTSVYTGPLNYGFSIPIPNKGLRQIHEIDYTSDFSYDNSKNQINLDKAYNFATQWMSSPRYRQMLSNSGGTDWWTNAADVAKARINNLNQIQKSPLYIKNDPNVTLTKNQLSGVGGYSNSLTGNIYVKPKEGAIINTLYDHEVSHSIDRPINNNLVKDFIKFYSRGMNYEPRLIPSKDINLMKTLVDPSISQKNPITFWEKYGNTPEEGTRNYYSNPTEVRARLNEIREILNEYGVDVFNKKITPAHYKIIKDYGPIKDLKNIYSDDNIIRLLNSISYAKPKSIDNNLSNMFYGQSGGSLPRAQKKFGGKLYYQEDIGELPTTKYGTPEYEEAYRTGNLLVNGVRPLPEFKVTPEYKSLSDELRRAAILGTKEAAELTGVPGAVRFVKSPVQSLKGAGNTIVDLGLTVSPFANMNPAAGFQYATQGTNPLTGEGSFRPQDVEGAFNTLDAAGLATIAGAGLKAPLQPLIKAPLQQGLRQSAKNSLFKSLNNKKTQFSKALQGTSKLFDEIKGELKQGKLNRKSIEEGNKWLENYINSPATQMRIDIAAEDAIKNIDKNYSWLLTPSPEDIQFKQTIINQETDFVNLIREQTKKFKPNSKEYSLLKQLEDNLEQYFFKNTSKPIHLGNWGVSYMHNVSPSSREAIKTGAAKPFDRYGSWISRTTKQSQPHRRSSTIHEGTHDWLSAEAFEALGQREIALDPNNVSKDAIESLLKKEKLLKEGKTSQEILDILGEKENYVAYLADPTEQHARIMELRAALDIPPDYSMSDDVAEKILNWIESGYSPVDKDFAYVVDYDHKKLKNLFNKFLVVPTIMGTGVATYGVNQMQNAQPTMQRFGGKLKYARGGSLTSAQDTAQAADLNKDVMRKDIKKASAFEDFMAFNYGVGAGFLDTISFGATDELTDAGFKALQSAAGHDVNSEEAKRQAGLKGWGNIGGAVGGAFLNPGAMGSAIEEGTEGLGQGIKGIDPNSPTATGIGTALEGMGSTKAFTGLNNKDKIPEGMEGFSKIFMARNGGRFRYGYQGGGHMLNQNMGLTEIDGPSHEEGGVTLPNNGGRPDVEVEGPETIYTPENYVMSEKMKASLEALEFAGITGKAAKRLAGKSYADLSKMIKSKAGDKLRPNDPLSKKMLDKEMKKLMMAHEYDREAKRMQEEAMRSQMMGGSNIVAETPEERAGGYNMYPNAQSIAFPGSGPTSVVPTYNNDPIMVTGADGSQQMLTDEPIETQAPFIEEKMAQGGKMIKRADGSYSRRGLWDNIRANRGSGKKPTKQMLEQEAKIKAAEKAYGGYYAEGGSFDNPGFRALPGYVQAKIKSNMEVGGYMGDYIGDDDTMEYGEGGYTVRRSNDRKGKTHVVIGPDGTKKYFGDPKLGERGKSKYGKDAFYARHKKNLAKNPYFRAYARATWEDGGYMDMLNANIDIPDMEAPMYAYGGPMMYAQGGIHIDPAKRGTFKAQASKMGMGVQEAARTILNAPEGKYSPAMRKKANFARNFAKEYGGYYQMGGEMMQAPQQGQPQGGGGEEQILQQVAQMLQQGMSPEEIVGQLVQMGVPQEQAIQIVQMVVQQMQGQQQAPQQAPPMMRGGGYMYQMGGEMAPQQQAQGGEEQIVQAIMQMLQQGMQPEEIVAQLVQMGLPQEAAIQAVQMVMQQVQQSQGMQQQQQAAPPFEQGMMGQQQGAPATMRGGGRMYQMGGSLADNYLAQVNQYPVLKRDGGKLYYQQNEGLLPNTTSTLENILNDNTIESGVYQGADAVAIGNQANANANANTGIEPILFPRPSLKERAIYLGNVNAEGSMPSVNSRFNPNFTMTPQEKTNWLNKTKGYSGLLPESGYKAIDMFENTMGTYDSKGNPTSMNMPEGYSKTGGSRPEAVTETEKYINNTIGIDTWNSLPDDIKTLWYDASFNSTDNKEYFLRALAQAVQDSDPNFQYPQNIGYTDNDYKNYRNNLSDQQALEIIRNADFTKNDVTGNFINILNQQRESIGNRSGFPKNYMPTFNRRAIDVYNNFQNLNTNQSSPNVSEQVVITPQKPVKLQRPLTLPRPAIPDIPTPTGPLSFEKYTPWRSNYAPIVAGGLAASAAPLANIITSFTAEDTRAAAPVKFERPGYEPVALQRAQANQAMANTREVFRRGAPTQGNYLSNLAVTAPSLAANVGREIAGKRFEIGKSRAEIDMRQQLANDIIGRFNIMNQGRDQAARNQLRMQGAAGLGDIGQGVITDVAKTIGQEEMLRALETKDFSPFKFERDARGRWRQVLSPRGAEYYMNSKGTNKVVTDSEGNQYEVLPNGTIRKMQ